MNKQPIFLKLGINYPQAQKRREWGLIWGMVLLAGSLALNVYLLWK